MAGKDSIGKKTIAIMAIIVIVVAAGSSLVTYFVAAPRGVEGAVKAVGALSIDNQRDAWIDISENIKGKVEYRCCLEEPCFYCIKKSPKHGEGATCICADEVVQGKHPCGVCMGEILEGHGVKALAPYFAKAISDEVGEQHLPELKKIIEEKYGVPVEEQEG